MNAFLKEVTELAGTLAPYLFAATIAITLIANLVYWRTSRAIREIHKMTLLRKAGQIQSQARLLQGELEKEIKELEKLQSEKKHVATFLEYISNADISTRESRVNQKDVPHAKAA
jgi:hypothetical protein